ncbi:MAG: S-layer homology domain-containing protein [Clostridia bacterium]|nr:S-layer homology domain-containing protein [Clostridia bacterium]
MKRSRKILSMLVNKLFCISLFATTVTAASQPDMYPEKYEYNVTQGETVKIKFKVFREFRSEKAHIRVHKGNGNGPIVASSDEIISSYSAITEHTVNWDTDNIEPGKYVVEYWISFYTMYEWHEPPTHKNNRLTINVKADLCKNGHNYDSGKVTKAATCKATGVNTKTCTVCGKKETSSIPKTEHQWDGGTIKVASSSTSAGNKVYTCKVCKETKTEVIPARFNDVDSNGYYAPAIDWAFDKGVTSGTTDSTFSPNDECTRGQVLTFLWRAMGSPNPKTSENPFKDVNSSQYYYKAILWGVEQGITGGTSPTTFSPEETCSYAHILNFIWRSQGKPDSTGTGEWYEDALTWSSDNGVLEETNAISNIESSCPRKDVVTYLYRILDEEGGKALQHKFGEWKITKEATCTSEGSKTRTCTECKEKQTKTIPMTEHSLGNANCTTPSKCAKCGAEVGSAKGHSWADATCLKAKTCSVCGATEGNALGHTTNNGTCGRCKEYISEPIVFSGTGDKIITGINLSEGLYKVSMSYNGKSNFIVVPYDGDGDRQSSWANEIGSYNGSTIFNESLTNGYIEVKASGTWTISINNITQTGTANLSGNGDCVSPFFELPKGAQVVKLNYDGDSNFIVVVYDNTGRRYSSLANEIGSYSGETIFNYGDPSKKFCIEVVANGEWSVDFGTTNEKTVCTQ